MTPAVLDTGVLIDHLRGHDPARRLLVDLVKADRPLVSSWVCRLEVRAGALQRERRQVEALIDAIDWLRVDEVVLEAAERLAVDLSPAHRGISAVDYVVAATCAVADGELLTTNVKDYPMLPGLRAPY